MANEIARARMRRRRTASPPMCSTVCRRPRKTPVLPLFLRCGAAANLFDEITRLPDYYPTRVETAILERPCARRCSTAPARSRAGRVRLRLQPQDRNPARARDRPRRLCADRHLRRARWRRRARVFRAAFRDLRVAADRRRFLRGRSRCRARSPARRVIGFFPGSTIGNFTPAEAQPPARRDAARARAGRPARHRRRSEEGPVACCIAAYNDPHGVTAAFNLNLLARINRELGGDFDLDGFGHQAIYDEARGPHRDASREPQAGSRPTSPAATSASRRGEAIHTESSYKYAVDEFRATARGAGWTPRRRVDG